MSKSRPTLKDMSEKYNKPLEEFQYREDGRIEWVCEHCIGHTVYSPHDYYVHGCDGCCGELVEGLG